MIFFANKSTAEALQQYVASIFQLLNIIAQDMNRSESLMRSAMGVIGYVIINLTGHDRYINRSVVTWLRLILTDSSPTRSGKIGSVL